MRSFWEIYSSSPDDYQNAYCCLLSATEYRGLPPAMIVLAEQDSLTPEGQAYAAALQRDGVVVRVKMFPRIQHAFFVFPSVMDEAVEVMNGCH